MDSFIILWLERQEYVLSNTILVLMIANFFMLEISSPIERFKNAYGLYSDTWAAITEAVINLGISFFFGRLYGIAGIMLGTLVSMLLIKVIWKPYFLYKNGFNKSVWLYWKGLLPVIIVLSVSAFLINYTIGLFPYNTEDSNYFNWALFATKVSLLTTFVYGLLMFIFIPGFKVFCLRVKDLILTKFFRTS